METDFKREIVKEILALSGSRAPYNIFYDWVECMALAIANSTTYRHDEIWQRRENQYLNIINSYDDKGESFIKMYGFLTLAFEDYMGDILGEIYMESGCNNKNTGQFFTPYHVSKTMAELSITKKDLTKPINLYEPSCGAGSAIIATAEVLKEKDINYQKSMNVVAQDLDWKAVYMTYIQLSMLGIKATVVQGDTLAEPFTGSGYPPERVFYTPMKIWRIC